MADNVVIVGLQAGDDYTTLAAALAAVPADLTTTGFDNWVIQIRDDQIHPGFSTPAPATDATHQLIVQAFPGNETNGKGEGATIREDRSIGVVRIENIDYFTLDGIAVIQDNAFNRSILSISGNQHPTIKNCFVVSNRFSCIEVANSSGGFTNIDNVICINTGGTSAVGFGNTTDFTTRTINRLTAVSIIFNGTVVNKPASGASNGRQTDYTNCLIFGQGQQTFQTLSGTIFIWDSDFNATDDNQGTINSLTTGFNGRLLTDDLEDPLGATPDYNLKSTSTLKGAGSGGSDVGATLGAAPVSINVPLATSGYSLSGDGLTVNLNTVIDLSEGSVTYNSFALSVDVTTEIPVPLQSPFYAFSPNPLFVDIAGEIQVPLAQGGYLYSAQGLDVTPNIDVNLQQQNYSISGDPLSVDVGSEITINLSSSSYSYSSDGLNVSVVGEVIIGLGEPNYTYNANNLIISIGEPTDIGNITASFKDSGISVGFEQQNITVKFRG